MRNLFPSLNLYFVLVLLSHRLSMRAVKEGVLVSVFQRNRAKGTRKADGVDSRLSLKAWEPGVLRVKDWYPNSSCQVESGLGLPPPFCSIQLSMDLIGPPTLGRAVFFTQSTNSNANLFLEHLQAHPGIIFSQLSGHPCGPVKLTHKINHHKSTPCQVDTHTYLLKPY